MRLLTEIAVVNVHCIIVNNNSLSTRFNASEHYKHEQMDICCNEILLILTPILEQTRTEWTCAFYLFVHMPF